MDQLLLLLLDRRELLRRAQVLERRLLGADVAAGVFADDIRHPERCCPSPSQERTQSLVEGLLDRTVSPRVPRLVFTAGIVLLRCPPLYALIPL